MNGVPAPGARAPSFRLASTAGGEVALEDFRGRHHVLLAFFPLAFTSTCTAELCAFSDDLDAFEALGAKVLGVSVDSVPALAAFRRQHGMTVELLSDFKREASRAYGVLMADTFFSRRAYFLIDPEGVVRWCHVERELADRRANDELLAAITAALAAP